MRSLITNLEIAPPKVEGPSDGSNKVIPHPYVADFMNFMTGLPEMPQEFQGGDTFSPENVEGVSPYPVGEHARRKIANIKDPIVKNIVESIQSSKLNDEDKDYLLTLGNRESSLNPNARHGSYTGLYQFNKDSLRTVGIAPDDYKNDVTKQFEAALRYKAINLKALDKYKGLIGKVYKGVLITSNGMAAAAHLLGAGTVMDFFDGTQKSERAKKGFKDALGTHISEYFNLFA